MIPHNNGVPEAPTPEEIEHLLEESIASLRAKSDRFKMRMGALDREFDLMLQRAAAAGRAEAERRHNWPACLQPPPGSR